MIDLPKNRRSAPGWASLFLVGPIIWYLYFWVVYLSAEAGCTTNTAALVSWITIGLTGASMLAIANYALPTSQSRDPRGSGPDDHDPLVGLGLLLGAFFVVATLFVGLPALVLQPC